MQVFWLGSRKLRGVPRASSKMLISHRFLSGMIG
jgi:hypothetical protein